MYGKSFYNFTLNNDVWALISLIKHLIKQSQIEKLHNMRRFSFVIDWALFRSSWDPVENEADPNSMRKTEANICISHWNRTLEATWKKGIAGGTLRRRRYTHSQPLSRKITTDHNFLEFILRWIHFLPLIFSSPRVRILFSPSADRVLMILVCFQTHWFGNLKCDCLLFFELLMLIYDLQFWCLCCSDFQVRELVSCVV